jgi:hypothetical protein
MSPSQEEAIIALGKIYDDANDCAIALEEMAKKAREQNNNDK